MSADFSAALARLLAQSVAGFRALRACERLSGGASQETWKVLADTVDGERCYALRRAAGGAPSAFAGAMGGIATEARLFQAARAAGVPSPEILRVFEPGDELGAGFLMEWLDGETLGARIVRGDALAALRPQLARQCGAALARIHAIDTAPFKDALPLRTPEQLVRETWQQYQSHGTPQPMIDFTARWLLDHLPPPVTPRLVHGDFRNGNLMIAPGRGITGVLDWELAHLGDPLRDLGWLCTASWRFGGELPVGGFGTLDDLLEGYAAVAGARPDAGALRFWTVFGSFWWSVGTLTMTQLHRNGSDRSAERAAIGRRSSECQIDCVNLLIPGPVQPLTAGPAPAALELPRADELLSSAIDFLRDEVAARDRGRTGFLARVASHSLEIVRREAELGPHARERECARLRSLLGRTGELAALRGELAQALRHGPMALDHPGLAEHLRQSVADQMAVDQPRYAGYQAALKR